jgi:prolipoprotein diacylglyceryltransferase
MIVALLVIYKNKKTPRQVGEITALGFMMLALSYVFITFLRGDIPANQIYFHLSRSQYFAMVMFAAGIFLFARTQRITGVLSIKEE